MKKGIIFLIFFIYCDMSDREDAYKSGDTPSYYRGKYCCPFSKDSVFKINDIVYEIIDRIDYWNVQRQREEFKYQMRGFGNDGEWFEVTHYKLINTPYKVASREEFNTKGVNVFNYRG